jgi:hypothetical protein
MSTIQLGVFYYLKKGAVMKILTAFEQELVKFINSGLQLNLIGQNQMIHLQPYRDGFAHMFQCGDDTSKRILVFFSEDRLYLNSLQDQQRMKEIKYGDLSSLGLAVDIVNAIVDEFTNDYLHYAAQAQQAAWN